jgi:hypothetical protein
VGMASAEMTRDDTRTITLHIRRLVRTRTPELLAWRAGLASYGKDRATSRDSEVPLWNTLFNEDRDEPDNEWQCSP